jgi:hypothetical protein
MSLAAVLSGGIKLFLSFKQFVGELVDRAVPMEALEDISQRVENKWGKWLLLKAMMIAKAKATARLTKLATSPKEILGALIGVGLRVVALAATALVMWMLWYFGEVPLIVTGASALLGAVGGWLGVRATADAWLNQLLEVVAGVSATTVRKAADKVGLAVIEASKS